jgi:hypothetical protein
MNNEISDFLKGKDILPTNILRCSRTNFVDYTNIFSASFYTRCSLDKSLIFISLLQ